MVRLAAGLLVLSTTLHAFAGEEMPSKTPIEVQGHRGARAVLPENTLAAFSYALSIGVDTLEMDLAVTEDDQVVVTHDLILDRKICLRQDGKKIRKDIPVASLTLKQLKTYDCGTLRNPRFKIQQTVPGERIPTLGEVFQLVKLSPDQAAKTVRFNLEIKGVPALVELTPEADRFVALVLAVLEKHQMLDRVVVQSFDHRVLKAVRKVAPAVPTAALVGETLPDFVAVARSAQASIVSPHRDWITREDVEALHAEGIKVIPWTANTPDEWDRLAAIGVDGIITDDPAGLIHYLKKKGAR